MSVRFTDEALREAVREAAARLARGEDPPLTCGQCMAPWTDHSYVLLGSAAPDSRDHHLIEELVAHSRWDRLPFPATHPQTEPLLLFRAIRCPSGAGFVYPGEFMTSVDGMTRFSGLRFDMAGAPVPHLGPSAIQQIGEIMGPWVAYSFKTFWLPPQ